MSRLWKTVSKGFRNFIGTANVETSNASSISSLPEHEFGRSCNVPNNVQHNDNSLSSENHNKKSEDNSYDRVNFKWSRLLSKSIFLEICGLSSAVALGWQFGQPYHTKNCHCINDSSSLVKILANLAIGTSSNGVRFSIGSTPPNLKPTKPASSFNSSTSQASDTFARTDLKLTITKEINKTLSGMLHKLNETDNHLGLADWQNSVGVELLMSAKKNELSEYDYLIRCKEKERSLAYQREAVLCFRESMKLGSAKGAYNLGICHEQGIGTSVDLDKATECYEEAALQCHSGARYNLALLHYRRYVESQQSNRTDLRTTFSLLRQAAQQGLNEAWSAILVILNNEIAAEDAIHSSTSSLVDESYENSLGSQDSVFRKAVSEPHDFNYFSDESTDEFENSSVDSVNGPVTFFVGD